VVDCNRYAVVAVVVVVVVIVVIIIIIIIIGFLSAGTFLELMVHPTTQASSFRLLRFPYYV
jgi:hypothetical protein